MAEIEEIWKPVVGYEGYYEVSNLGRVRSVERPVISKKGHLSIYSSFILKPDVSNGARYKRVTLSVNNKTKRFSVHRLVAMAFIPNPENKPQVNHIDCDSLNNCASNLEWCTMKENMEHAAKNLRTTIGERNYFCVLKEDIVLKIRQEASNLSVKELAEKYKQSKTNIRDIINRKLWKHI